MKIIEVKNLSKSFKNKKILSNVNFSIKKSEFVAFIGCSGSGKSVLLKTIIGFYNPTSGEVEVNGKVGFSTQENSLYESLTLEQNLRYFSSIYGVENRKEIINSLIEVLDLKNFRKMKVKNLSGGTKKRADLACALIESPDILVLDEPFTGLDFSLVKRLGIFLKKLQVNGTTILMSSHNLPQIETLCNRFFLVDNSSVREINLVQLKEVFSIKV